MCYRRLDGNQDICANDSSLCQQTSTKSSSKKFALPVIIVLCVIPIVLLSVGVLIFWGRKKSHSKHFFSLYDAKLKFISDLTSSIPESSHWSWCYVVFSSLFFPQKESSSNQVSGQEKPLQLETRQFTYIELKKITNGFKRALGKGGFGSVYHGTLEDGTEVAVKMRSESSSQGTKEFLSEVTNPRNPFFFWYPRYVELTIITKVWGCRWWSKQN